jgi:enoyl-CoA hydratase/carnithine racemase
MLGAMTPEKRSKIYFHWRRLLLNLLETECPVIAPVTGAAKVHAEIALLSDIVVAADDAYFQDAPHFRYDTVPGDGAHLIWPALLGGIRGRYCLLTGQRISATEAHNLGVVSDVVSADTVLERARELVAQLAAMANSTMRYTRRDDPGNEEAANARARGRPGARGTRPACDLARWLTRPCQPGSSNEVIIQPAGLSPASGAGTNLGCCTNRSGRYI